MLPTDYKHYKLSLSLVSRSPSTSFPSLYSSQPTCQSPFLIFLLEASAYLPLCLTLAWGPPRPHDDDDDDTPARQKKERAVSV